MHSSSKNEESFKLYPYAIEHLRGKTQFLAGSTRKKLGNFFIFTTQMPREILEWSMTALSRVFSPDEFGRTLRCGTQESGIDRQLTTVRRDLFEVEAWSRLVERISSLMHS